MVLTVRTLWNHFQKLLIDEKSYYLFGRNKDVCDFVLEHQSVSRVHAALVYHKHLDRPFLVDLGSSEYKIHTILNQLEAVTLIITKMLKAIH